MLSPLSRLCVEMSHNFLHLKKSEKYETIIITDFSEFSKILPKFLSRAKLPLCLPLATPPFPSLKLVEGLCLTHYNTAIANIPNQTFECRMICRRRNLRHHDEHTWTAIKLSLSINTSHRAFYKTLL